MAMSNVPKTTRERLQELRGALLLIEYSLKAASQSGEEAHMLSVVGQLRALLVSSGQTPLLLDLAERLGFQLEFYSIPLDFLDNEEIAQILGPTRIQWTGDSIRANPEGPPFHQKVTMKDWLASTQIVVRGNKITGEELLKMVANKLGGAHYDTILPAELAAIKPFQIGGWTSFYLTLSRLSEVVIQLGQRLLAHAEVRCNHV